MMHVLRCKQQLLLLKNYLDQGFIRDKVHTLIARGLLQSVLEGLWQYEAVVDRWPETPTSVVFRPVQSNQLPFINRNVYIVSSNMASLSRLLQQHNCLPWHQQFNFLRLPVPYVESVEAAVNHHGGKLRKFSDKTGLCSLKKVPVPDARSIPLPEGFHVGPLEPRHATIVQQGYPPPESRIPDEWINRTEYIIRHMPSAGMFDAEGRLVSWATTHLEGIGGQGYTLSEYRGQRLLTPVLKFLAEQHFAQGRVFFSFIDSDNLSSLKATKLLGDIVGEPVMYCRYEPPENTAKL